jgi:FkbM family methyltransferase
VSEGRLARLDDELHVHASSAIEARFIYQEIFRAGCYGVPDLPSRPFVVDVGANIGLFVLYLKRRYPDAEVLAFEPMPQTAALLRKNLALHGLSAVTVHEVALGSAAENGVPFTFYPMIPGNSTRHPETKVAAKAALAKTVPEKLAERMYRGRETTVDVARLSAFLAEGRTIDLLKIDVEGAEIEVLHGIDAQHWPQVRRVVMEVHDLDGRLEEACDLLRGRGLQPGVRPASLGDADSPTHLVHAAAADNARRRA